jgi:hypothetical protein
MHTCAMCIYQVKNEAAAREHAHRCARIRLPRTDGA